jgi:uncharacterized membrane protein AbrB (regulator of aidB expression)
MRALARAYGKDERYVARVLQLAFLAPKIVELVVTGNQPIEMTAQGLITLSDLSPSWTEQNFRIFGEAPATARIPRSRRLRGRGER